MFEDRLYVGRLIRQRNAGRGPYRRDRLLALRLDLDRLPVMADRLRLFGVQGPAPVTLHEGDYAVDGVGPIGPWLRQQLRHAGVADAGQGRIELLCLPRIWGALPHRLGVFLCHRDSGALAAVYYAMEDASGRRHEHFFAVSPITPSDAGGLVLRHGGYQLTLWNTAGRFALAVHELRPGGQRLELQFQAVPASFDDRHLLSGLATQTAAAGRVGLGALWLWARKAWDGLRAGDIDEAKSLVRVILRPQGHTGFQAPSAGQPRSSG